MSIRRNALINLVGQVVPIAVILLTVPPYLELIGAERYGVLTICWTILGYFGVFDFGLSRATAQRMAILRGASDTERSELLWTALTLNTILGMLAGALFWGGTQVYLNMFTSVGGSLREELSSGLPWLAAAIPVNILSAALTGGLQGRERFLALNATQVLGTALAQILPLLVAALHRPQLDQIIPSVLAARLITTLVMLMACRRCIPLAKRPRFNPALLRPLFSYGGWVSVSSLTMTVLYGLERVMIGALSGAMAVTYYSVPQSLVNRIKIVPAALSNALFPRFAAECHDRRLELQVRSVHMILIVMTPLVIIGLLLVEPFLALWINTEFAQHTARVGEILLIGMWIVSSNYIAFTFLQGEGNPRLVALSESIILVPHVLLLYFGLQHFGYIGAALAWLARAQVSTIILSVFARMGWIVLRAALIPAILVGMTAMIVFTHSMENPQRWVLGGGLMLATSIWVWQAISSQLGTLMPLINRRAKITGF